jgi:hypothetical protein
MPTPDPSASLTPWREWVVAASGYGADQVAVGLDLVRLLIFALVLLGGVVALCSTALVVSRAGAR